MLKTVPSVEGFCLRSFLPHQDRTEQSVSSFSLLVEIPGNSQQANSILLLFEQI